MSEDTRKFIYLTLNITRRVNMDDVLKSREAEKAGEHMPFTFLVDTPVGGDARELEVHIHNASIGTPAGFPKMLIFEAFLCGTDAKEPIRGWVLLDTDPDKDGRRAGDNEIQRNTGFEVLGMLQIRIDPKIAMKEVGHLTAAVKVAVDAMVQQTGKGKQHLN